MYIPEEMKKENKFIDVAIPSNKSFFARLGESAPLPSQYTGDEPAIMNQDKIAQIDDYLAYAKMMSEKGGE